MPAQQAPPTLRRRLVRRFARARWDEYRRFLEGAIAEGYAVVPLDHWVRRGHGDAFGERVLVLRHDVDQQPGSVAPMAAIEESLGIRATWYLRWRTADPRVISALARRGHTVGLHYETLTRRARELRLGRDDDATWLVDECRELLRDEIVAWARRFGRARSVCPHGDTGVPWLTNAVLMQGLPASSFGVEFDSNEAMRGRGLAYWLTDRSIAEGGWRDSVDPQDLFADGLSPVLCVTHPNNWSSGASIWADRALGRSVPRAVGRALRRQATPRTGSDDPPLR